MSDDSDDQFESADEDIDFEPTTKTVDKVVAADQIEKVAVDDKVLPQLADRLKICDPIQVFPTKSDPVADEHNDCQQESDEQLEKNELRVKSEELIARKSDIDSKPKEVKTVIKGRKLMRKADRLRNQNQDEDQDYVERSEKKPQDSGSNRLTDSSESSSTSKISDVVVDKSSDSRIISQKEESDKPLDRNKTEKKDEEKVVEDNDDNEEEIKEVKTSIKGRKLVRKTDRHRDQSSDADEEVLEQKKSQVLSKLSDLGESNTTSSWNNWFSDIKSAAKTATSTTVSHMSQASNKWSFDPKSLLSSAATITTTVGSGLSSVVDNVASVMDNAIGAPPPEQMAAMSAKDDCLRPQDTNNEPEVRQKSETGDKPSGSGFGFGLFDYTRNTLESIGKKSPEVVRDDKKKD